MVKYKNINNDIRITEKQLAHFCFTLLLFYILFYNSLKWFMNFVDKSFPFGLNTFSAALIVSIVILGIIIMWGLLWDLVNYISNKITDTTPLKEIKIYIPKYDYDKLMQKNLVYIKNAKLNNKPVIHEFETKKEIEKYIKKRIL